MPLLILHQSENAHKSDALECFHAGGSKESINKMWDPIAYALGFLDCKDISARCMLSIFHFFATKTDASVLRMLNGSPRDRLLQPIMDYIEARGGKIHLRTGVASRFERKPNIV